jgi:hypothetical protein
LGPSLGVCEIGRGLWMGELDGEVESGTHQLMDDLQGPWQHIPSQHAASAWSWTGLLFWNKISHPID